MGASGKTEAEREAAVSDGVPAAIAVVSDSGSIERATRVFMDWVDARAGSLPAWERELEQIAVGDSDRLTAHVDGVEADLVAVIDREDRRAAVLTLPTALDAADGSATSPLLDEPLDESPAIVWLKDLEGRYLRVNRRYAEQLGIDAEEVRGRTDAELTAAKSIEGLRLDQIDSAARDPLELEYRIGAFEERPAFTALRFALRDRDGQPTGTCSVAAPIAEAALARSECERLMKLDRWSRLDAFAIRQELLDEWGLTLADGSSGPPLDRDDRVAAALAERDEARASTARLEQELAEERRERDSLRADSERTEQRVLELHDAIAAERARSDELEQALGRSEARADDLQSELTSVKADLEEQVRRAEVLDAVAAASEEKSPTWGADPQRALSAALAGLTEWQGVLKQTVRTLGSEGRWDATIVWCPGAPSGIASMKCAAIWLRDEAALASFETLAWQHLADGSAGEVGRARSRMATTCLLELESAEDSLIRAAAAEGMRSALVVPVGAGGETIAMLSCFSRAEAQDAELMVALDAIALQLGAIAQLIKLADAPRWRMGRA